jgi:hypothetical protein
MNVKLVLGAVLLVAGIALFITGVTSSDSFADQLSKTFTGRFTESTQWYIVGGLVAGVAGLITLVASGRGGKTA